MSARAAVVLVLLAPALAGCLGASPPAASDAADPLLAAARITAASGTVSGTEPLFWQGGILTLSNHPACGATNCERFRFQLDVPPGFWEKHDGALEVSIRWPVLEAWTELQSGFFALSLRDADGRLLAEGSGEMAQVILLENAPAGVYEAVIIGRDRNGGWNAVVPAARYEGVVQLEIERKGGEPPRDLLPDLVTMQPMSLRIERPGFCGLRRVQTCEIGETSNAALVAAGNKGCLPYEAAEAQAQRCLRFQNAPGNIGEGPFDVRLEDTEILLSLAGQGRFVQRIHRDDGSFHDEPVGVARYHPTHAHVHYEEFTRFTVYRYDLATGERGDIAGEGLRKVGFCAGDMGLVALGQTGTTLPGTDYGCATAVQAPGSTWSAGIRPGWWDAYSAFQDDQYVEMNGATDGVYVLVSVVDPGRTVRESDVTNNEASVVFWLTGDLVEVLSSTGLPLGPEAP